MPIYVLETTRRCAASWSRHCRFVRTPSLEGHGLIDELVKLASQLGCRPVLILTSDESVDTVSAHRELIEPLYRISLPSAEVVRALADKTLFHTLAESEGFAVPRAVALSDTADLSLLQVLVPPLILKPADKTLVLKGIAERAVRADTMVAARAIAARMLACAPRIIAQEWIEGPDTEIFFTLFSCDRAGNVIGLFSGRKLVCSPPQVGSTAICIAAPEMARELCGQTLQFIAQVSYRGLGSLEFKRDRRTGQFLIIEPTVGRTDWQEEIATLCGVNLPLLTYRAEIGLAEPPCADRPAGLVAWRSSREFRSPPLASTPGVRMVDGYLRWSDPLPALYHYAYERFAHRIWRRATAGNRCV